MSQSKRLVMVGASGHGKVCAEIAESSNIYREILFLDDNLNLQECGGFKIVGTVSEYKNYLGEETEFFVSIGNNCTRRMIQDEIKRTGCKIATLIHDSAVVGKDVVLGEGTVLMAGAVINTGTRIGKGCIVNTSSSVDHDCIIENYVHIAVGAHICGGVEIGESTWIGAGAIVNNYHSICKGCMVGSGAVVIRDIDDPGVYIGVPATKKEAKKCEICDYYRCKS